MAYFLERGVGMLFHESVRENPQKQLSKATFIQSFYQSRDCHTEVESRTEGAIMVRFRFYRCSQSSAGFLHVSLFCSWACLSDAVLDSVRRTHTEMRCEFDLRVFEQFFYRLAGG